jgi:anti-sigma factor ChrR (cupin superfamily)
MSAEPGAPGAATRLFWAGARGKRADGHRDFARAQTACNLCLPRLSHFFNFLTSAMLVLDGDQFDEEGAYPAGSFVIHPPGTRHSPGSMGGCIALLIYEKGVRFVEGE